MAFQGSLDEFLPTEDVKMEKKAEEVPKVEAKAEERAEKETEAPPSVEAVVEERQVEGPKAEQTAEEPRLEERGETVEAPCCDAKPIIPRELKLHIGSAYLYRKGGEWRAMADIDHAYRKCRVGLVKNLRALKRVFDHVAQQASVFAVGKGAYDDLYVYYVGSGRVSEIPQEFRGLTVHTFKFEGEYDDAVKRFMETNYFMEDVSVEVVGEAVGPQALTQTDPTTQPCCKHGGGNVHKGAALLYKKGPRFVVRADIDHVYGDCEGGLLKTVRVLKDIYDHARERCINVFAVSKGYHENIALYIHVEDYEKLTWPKFKSFFFQASTYGGKLDKNIDFLEMQNSHMQVVGEEVVRKALSPECETAEGG